MISRAYAAVAYAAFLAVSLWGVLFLADVGPLPTVDSPGPTTAAVLVDLGLWLVFGLQHSVMARARAKRGVPRRIERSTYVLATGLALGLLFWQWRPLPATVWRVDDQPWAGLLWAVFGAGWVVAVAATYMVDHLEFLGLRQAGWFPARPQGSLSRRWLYAWVRHPMMTGLLVAFWATPVMTAGHVLFAAAASVYIAIGLHFEERDLHRTLGPAYATYAREVPRLVPHRRVPARPAQAGPQPVMPPSTASTVPVVKAPAREAR